MGNCSFFGDGKPENSKFLKESKMAEEIEKGKAAPTETLTVKRSSVWPLLSLRAAAAAAAAAAALFSVRPLCVHSVHTVRTEDMRTAVVGR
ncbi:hypothetical protein JOB18_014398 [Solea senegalensis]|uniref:Uncharacterized protein n=1 Tax=Solea senegalensis TaxID=28829 RepID=A0AAV6RMG5_SOLSE|nr:hypothetical protein JOB18_014398 [Solea senegalensis]